MVEKSLDLGKKEPNKLSSGKLLRDIEHVDDLTDDEFSELMYHKDDITELGDSFVLKDSKEVKEPKKENANELKIVWCHNIATNEDYKNDNLHNDTCKICKNHSKLRNFNSYLSSDVPLDLLVKLAKEWGFEFTEKEILAHQDHILPLYDEDIRDKIKKDMKAIESELPIEVNTDLVINSTLRTLMARRLALEKNGETESKEYATTIDKILKFSELKLKKEGKLQPDKEGGDTHIHVDLRDVILGVGGNASIEDEVQYESTSGAQVASSTEDEDRQTCGIGIPHKGH